MKCLRCGGNCVKKGKTLSGVQKLKCLSCSKNQRELYKRNGFKGDIERMVVTLLKESCGIRSIARVLKVSTTTVLVIIRRVAKQIEKPVLKMNRSYEADEVKTYVGDKENYQWVMYAIDKKTREPVDFRVGRRNKTNLRNLIQTLLLAKAKLIYTDRLNIYPGLIPEEIHKPVAHTINYIERKNLNLRTHLKRISRKTICYSKSIIMLEAIVKIYFWG